MSEQTPRVEQGQQVPPGWYPDPKMAGTQRYWDGASWSEHVAPGQQFATRSPADVARSTSNLEMWGWLGAVFVTPVGFVIAIILLSRGHAVGRSVAMLVVSLVMTSIGYAVLSNNAATY